MATGRGHGRDEAVALGAGARRGAAALPRAVARQRSDICGGVRSILARRARSGASQLDTVLVARRAESARALGTRTCSAAPSPPPPLPRRSRASRGPRRSTAAAKSEAGPAMT
eukprot:352144-Chlamydomonas_euryale.AAC.3